jgi:hypothetical protein
MFVLVYVLGIQAEEGIGKNSAVRKGRIGKVSVNDKHGDKGEDWVVC